MKGMSSKVRAWSAGIGAVSLAGGALAQAQALENRYAAYTPVVNIAEGLSWPKGQAVPTFATPAASLDMIPVSVLSPDELITFSSLQGRVNRKQPRILLVQPRSEEGEFTWADTAGLTSRHGYGRENRYELLAKYAKEVDGVVLYDQNISPHYRNLAGTVAPQHNALPVSRLVYEEIKKAGIDLKVLVDLTELTFKTPVEIYRYMHERYWPKAEKRLIVSVRPQDRGDLHHTRDIAAATGAAVVWLDTLVPEERDVLRTFFADMKAGEAIALGWYATERTGITTASEYGIGTMPADFYVSGSVWAGTDHKIKIPAVPKKPELENKVYISIIVSDGDNIQYTQHAMRKHWDALGDNRGKIPLSWTIAPGLVDMGPAIINYYYSNSTPNDCFITGPSGMGYLMPINTLEEPGAPVGESLKDPARMDGYTRMTETFLQRSGLRTVTIWDDASPALRKSYEENCRNLYGVTVQNFKDMPSVSSSVEGERVRFDKLIIPYAGSYEHISRSLTKEIRDWDGKGPRFLSYQADVWNELRVHRLVELHEHLQKEFPGKVEFVRADHYFTLYNEANKLPFNLAMSASVKASAGDSPDTAALLDGTPVTLWTSAKPGKQHVDFDLGGKYLVSRCVIRHAGDGGMGQENNTRDFAIQTSADGKTWKTLGVIKGNKDNVTDVDLPRTTASHLRILIDKPGEDSTVRIADVEIYGAKL